jgi:glycosyltransferase involved in cell wall biosynthesis
MPKVSIILPTFNRADTIMRAIKSAQAQTFQDWELIVVDDGSTDNTAALLEGLDPRLKLIRQDNRGFTEARNTGIRAGSGDYFAFLDSDDEYLPHHLELCVAFLETFKEAQFVSTELLEDFGHGRVVRHFRIETSEWYPQKAALIGSHGLDLPPGETDDYMRVYESREPIGDWGSHIVERVGPVRGAFHYRGMIFEHMRYDFLNGITATVVRSTAFETVGLPDPRWFMGSDFHFLACLSRTWMTNFLSVPTFIKHEYAADGVLPSHGHVVTGKSALSFATDWQTAWDDLFWNTGSQDRETRALRSLRKFWVGQVALNARQRELALRSLEEAREGLPRFWRAIALYWFVRCLPGSTLSAQIYGSIGRIAHFYERIVSHGLFPKLFQRKALAVPVGRRRAS